MVVIAVAAAAAAEAQPAPPPPPPPQPPPPDSSSSCFVPCSGKAPLDFSPTLAEACFSLQTIELMLRKIQLPKMSGIFGRGIVLSSTQVLNPESRTNRTSRNRALCLTQMLLPLVSEVQICPNRHGIHCPGIACHWLLA